MGRGSSQSRFQEGNVSGQCTKLLFEWKTCFLLLNPQFDNFIPPLPPHAKLECLLLENKEREILYDSEMFLLVDKAAEHDAILLFLARVCGG